MNVWNAHLRRRSPQIENESEFDEENDAEPACVAVCRHLHTEYFLGHFLSSPLT